MRLFQICVFVSVALQLKATEAAKHSYDIAPSVKQLSSDVIYFTDSEPFEPLNIKCETDGNPKPTFKWMKNGEELNEHIDTLKISMPQTGVEGEYQCFAQNQYGIGRLSPVFVRNVSSNSSGLTITVGETEHLMLNCSTTNWGPGPKIHWKRFKGMKEPMEIDSNDPRIIAGPNGTLHFTSVNKSDEDYKYACYATLQGGTQRQIGQTYCLSVLAYTDKKPKAQIITPLQEMHAKTGESIEMFCIYTRMDDLIMFWTKNGDAVVPNERIELRNNNQKLIIKNVTDADGGTYNCSIGDKGSSNTLLVMPSISHKVQPGRNGHILRCEPQKPEGFSFKWTKDGNPIEDAEDALYTIEEPNSTPVGVYGCNASFGSMYLYHEFAIPLTSLKPEFISRPSDKVVKRGENITFHCNVYGIPIPQIKWLHKNRELKSDYGHKVVAPYDLFIENVKSRDAGEYTCQASNSKGTASASAELFVNSPTSSQIQNFVAIPVGSTSFLLKWEKPNTSDGLLIGYNITYGYRHSSSMREVKNVINIRPYITQIRLNDLKSNTDYHFSIISIVIKGKLSQQQPTHANATTRDDNVQKQPDKPSFTWKYLRSTGESAQIQIKWRPSLDGYAGSEFCVKYRAKSQPNWTVTANISNVDYIDIENLKVNETYEFVVLSIDGDFSIESSSQNILMVKIDTELTPTVMGDVAYVGQKLQFDCKIKSYNLSASGCTNLTVNWNLPRDNAALRENRMRILNPICDACTADGTFCDLSGRLIIDGVEADKDEGEYECVVEDDKTLSSATASINYILRICDPILGITPIGDTELVLNQSQTVNLRANVVGHPIPTITWYTNANEMIRLPWTSAVNSKYVTVKNKENFTLTIVNASVADSGTYLLTADNRENKTQQSFTLKIFGKPELFGRNVTATHNQITNLTCNIMTCVEPKVVVWTFAECDSHQVYSDPESCNGHAQILNQGEHKLIENENGPCNYTSKYNLLANRSGIFTCTADNEYGKSATLTRTLLVHDLAEEFVIIDTKEVHINGDMASVTCGLASYKYSEFDWYVEDTLIDDSTLPNVKIISTNTTYSQRKELQFTRISPELSGEYICRARTFDNITESKSWPLDVKITEKPVLKVSTCSESSKERDLIIGSNFTMECYFEGFPMPNICWQKIDDYGRVTNLSSDRHYQMNLNRTKFSIIDTTKHDQGKYKCFAENHAGTSEDCTIGLQIHNQFKYIFEVTLGASVLIVLLLICTIYLCIRNHRHRRRFEELKKAGLGEFELGNVENINPELPIDEQIHMLPYDPKFEFPRNKLEIGKILGSGAFGVVHQGVAHGILEHEEKTTVAIKRVRKVASNEVLLALVSELKIMVHLGKHLNIINLLGAVTKNIANLEVMVIVDFCEFGCLLDYLRKHREQFINQFESNTIESEKKAVPTPTQMTRPKTQKAIYSKQSNLANCTRELKDLFGANTKQALLKTDKFDDLDGTATIRSRRYTNIGALNDDAVSVVAATSTGAKNAIDSEQSISSSDLVSWSFQVARGMGYLAQRRIIHGDLAARNILLCADNVVKIGDFGLARSLQGSDYIKARQQEKTPYKWTAPEVLGYNKFTLNCDIWSYGIVLWELFSLGQVPYAGMHAGKEFYDKITVDGYRMEKPEFASDEIYKIMMSCWKEKPEERPPFNKLEEILTKILGPIDADYYIGMNEPYDEANNERFNSGQTDYLALLGAPDYPAPSAPQCMAINSRYVTSASFESETLANSSKVNLELKGHQAKFNRELEESTV